MNSLGPGVSPVLEVEDRSFDQVVWQDHRPPMASEANLDQQILSYKSSVLVGSASPSGFLRDPLSALSDFDTNPLDSNQFFIRSRSATNSKDHLVALVNGWVVQISGTDNPEGTHNRVRLNPPPLSGQREDFVFLEVWKALVSPNPSTANKPSSSSVWRFGNVGYGGSNPADDLIHPVARAETTKRVQIQYRLRVFGGGDSGSSVDFVSYPDGLGDPQVRAQGPLSSPGPNPYVSMSDLGDPGLWRSGSGDPSATGTVDGYVYAIPVVAVRRRNASPFTDLTSGTPNHNGATERTPNARYLPVPSSGSRRLTTVSLTSYLAPGAVGPVSVSGLSGSGFDDPRFFPAPGSVRYIVVGDGEDQEIVSITAVNPTTGTITIEPGGRGRGGSGVRGSGRSHPVGSTLRLLSSHPEGLYSDQVLPSDLRDLRRCVSLGDWDYNRLLQGGLVSLLTGSLATTAKSSSGGGNTRGVETVEVSSMMSPSSGSVPTHSEAVDGPDGVRTIWSDSSALQSEITVILDPSAPSFAGFISSADTNLSTDWSVSAPFSPSVFLNHTSGWVNGSSIFLRIGGSSGSGGARYGLRSEGQPRFVSPREMSLPGLTRLSGSQSPVSLRFLGGSSGNSPTGPSNPAANAYRAAAMAAPASSIESLSDHPGPYYPVDRALYERPLIVLGDVVRSDARYTVVANSTNFRNSDGTYTFEIRVPGQNWNTIPEQGYLLGSGNHTLRDLLTDFGRDPSGLSSHLYLVVYGDNGSRDNNGAFKIVGAGTRNAQDNIPFTDYHGSDSSSLVVRPLSADFVEFVNTGNSVTLEIRSQEITCLSEVTGASPASVCVVLTDLKGSNGGFSSGDALPLPWSSVTNPLREDSGTSKIYPIASKAVLSLTVLWPPGHGGVRKVPTRILRAGLRSGDPSFLRPVLSSVDPPFTSAMSYPVGDRVWDSTPHVQLWNRLPSLGLNQNGWSDTLPVASSWGGNAVGGSESDRESEIFVDPGSKTVIFRPFSVRRITLKALTCDPTAIPGSHLWVDSTYAYGPQAGSPIDGGGIFTSGLLTAVVIPPEFMPRFGRQDIPVSVGTSEVLPGVNHLFVSKPQGSESEPVFSLLGGERNTTGGALAMPFLFTTSLDYGSRGTIGGAAHPTSGARKIHLPEVVSSDLGSGLKGIELPPYHGIGRLYGVYEAADFLSHLSPSQPGGFLSDRVTPNPTGPTNLLRKFASKQTLYIRRGGARDVCSSEEAHTYVVPSDALDLSLIPSWTSGSAFEDFDYVVECEVFGFARGFISQNSYVLLRRRNGVGAALAEGDNPELVGVTMALPSAAPAGSTAYLSFRRRVYQGDPYGTRGLTTPETSDPHTRYGMVRVSDAWGLSSSIQQDSVEVPNVRPLEVLASCDFYTTLGTGKIGGRFWRGTVLDCASLDSGNGRIPASVSSPQWVSSPRVFSSLGREESRASLALRIKDYSSAITYHLRVTFSYDAETVSLRAPTHFTGSSNSAMASQFADAVNAAFGKRVRARVSGDTVYLYAVASGFEGNKIRVSLQMAPALTTAAGSHFSGRTSSIAEILFGDGSPMPDTVSSSYMVGGSSSPTTAGTGDSEIFLGGLTERLPLGALVSDYDFLSENPLGDSSSSLWIQGSTLRSTYQNLPLTSGGSEFTRYLGEPGSVLCLSDGTQEFSAYSDSNPSGSRVFRLHRGGGSVFVGSGTHPGCPVSWVVQSFSPSVKPVLKGAALVGKALLVRNFKESAFSASLDRSPGGEVQLLILTYAVYGGESTARNGLTLAGTISPTGFGEGYAAADRYLLPGRPLSRSGSRVIPSIPDPTPYHREV